MKELTGCCGFKCHRCPAYEGNIKNDGDRERVSARWLEYFNFAEAQENIGCKGCLASDEHREHMLHPQCQYRDCVKEKNLVKCKDCGSYPCDKLRSYGEANRNRSRGVFVEARAELFKSREAVGAAAGLADMDVALLKNPAERALVRAFLHRYKYVAGVPSRQIAQMNELTGKAEKS